VEGVEVVEVVEVVVEAVEQVRDPFRVPCLCRSYLIVILFGVAM